MATNEELLSRGLPKWPQLLLYGNSIEANQALEIIRRTDTFFTHEYSGNNHTWNAWVRDQLKMIPDKDKYDTNKYFALSGGGMDWEKYFAWNDAWNIAWGSVKTNYVQNSWVSSSFIYGAHGWCHPDGKLFHCHNVGKWPAVSDIYDDFKELATLFPFLDFGATLYSSEECDEDKEPVVSFRVKDGQVELVDPEERDVFKDFMKSGVDGLEGMVQAATSDTAMMAVLSRRFAQQEMRDPEVGIDPEVIEYWAEEYGAKLPTLPKKAAI